MFWVAVQKTFDEVPAFGAKGVSWKSDFAESDVLVHLLRVLGIKGTPSTAHLEH